MISDILKQVIPKIKRFSAKSRARSALIEINKFNRINDDIEAYLFNIAKWGLGEAEKPDPKDYGIE